ncbi:hypothetical protein [Trueperella sp.]|uniref:hypothetical protein n=1 Tax=Trueperella sp. TaxID=2699835 RepID=UPI00373655EF
MTVTEANSSPTRTDLGEYHHAIVNYTAPLPKYAADGVTELSYSASVPMVRATAVAHGKQITFYHSGGADLSDPAQVANLEQEYDPSVTVTFVGEVAQPTTMKATRTGNYYTPTNSKTVETTLNNTGTSTTYSLMANRYGGNPQALTKSQLNDLSYFKIPATSSGHKYKTMNSYAFEFGDLENFTKTVTGDVETGFAVTYTRNFDAAYPASATVKQGEYPQRPIRSPHLMSRCRRPV